MTVEGQLRFTMREDGSGAYAVELQSTRPVHAAKIFVGKSADEVLSILPRLFRVCGIAQAGAAVVAMQKALGLDADNRLAGARNVMILLETAREHLWRIAVDWAEFAGLEPEPGQVRALDCLIPEMQSTLFSSESAFQLDSAPGDAPAASAIDELRQILELTVFGVDPRDWLSISSVEKLERWSRSQATPAALFLRQVIDAGWAAAGSTDATALPQITDAAINSCLAAPDADSFVATPTWDGATCETTPLQRSAAHSLVADVSGGFGAGLLARAVAVLVELAGIPGSVGNALEQDGCAEATEDLPDHTGVGQVEAARGRLVHRVVVVNDIVNEYRILAPTEWNFHPRGALLRGLSTIPADDPERVRQMGSALITAVDPCVGFELAVH